MCSQCQKAKRKCGGYRDAVDMMFRDQSEEVISKALTGSKTRNSTTTAATTPRTSRSPDECEITNVATNAPAVPLSPKLNEENGLIAFLLNNFTCSDSAEMRSNYYWIPRNCDDLLKDDSAKLSVQCAGAMALARLRRSPEYLRKAQRDYGIAVLSLVKSWQQNPQDDSDTVFVAVLFLALFELLASYGHSSQKSWTAHLSGLGGLFEQRGAQHLHTEFGFRMFRQSRSQVIANALRTKTPVPGSYARLSQCAPMQFKQADVIDMLLIRLADLQASYQALKPATHLRPALMDLDLDLRRWTTGLPNVWMFSKQPVGRHTGMWWDVRSDIYSSAIIAHLWNKVRSARIAIRDLLLDINARPSSALADNAEGPGDHSEHSISQLEVQQLVTDACATVPIYYRPWSTTVKGSRASSPPPLGTTFWTVSVLEVVGSMKYATPLLTKWSLQCLEHIHEKTGVMQARYVARRLEHVIKMRHSHG